MFFLFRDRNQAGEALANQLVQLGWKAKPPDRLFGLARGGLAIASPVAKALNCPLEVLVVRKIGAPGNEELGVGAICEDGIPLFSRSTMAALHLKPEDLLTISARKRQETEEKILKYRGSPLNWEKKTGRVLVIDDGLATGISAEAAALFLRKKNVQQIALAVPVAASASAEALLRPGKLYDEVITLERFETFGSVGSWYEDFQPVSDDQVLNLLCLSRDR